MNEIKTKLIKEKKKRNKLENNNKIEVKEKLADSFEKNNVVKIDKKEIEPKKIIENENKLVNNKVDEANTNTEIPRSQLNRIVAETLVIENNTKSTENLNDKKEDTNNSTPKETIITQNQLTKETTLPSSNIKVNQVKQVKINKNNNHKTENELSLSVITKDDKSAANNKHLIKQSSSPTTLSPNRTNPETIKTTINQPNKSENINEAIQPIHKLKTNLKDSNESSKYNLSNIISYVENIKILDLDYNKLIENKTDSKYYPTIRAYTGIIVPFFQLLPIVSIIMAVLAIFYLIIKRLIFGNLLDIIKYFIGSNKSKGDLKPIDKESKSTIRINNENENLNQNSEKSSTLNTYEKFEKKYIIFI